MELRIHEFSEVTNDTTKVPENLFIDIIMTISKLVDLNII